MNKIFIAGCGRSGTTLMLRLFRAYRDCIIMWPEAPVSIFNRLAASRFYCEERKSGSVKVQFRVEVSASNVIVKRTGQSWKDLPRVPDDIKVLYMVRNPFDVLTSYHESDSERNSFYISPKRWMDEYSALKELRQAKSEHEILVVRYEDLVISPNDEQQRISEFTGCVPKSLFTECENISRKSVEKYKERAQYRDYLRCLKSPAKKQVIEFCHSFGYEDGVFA